MQAATNKKHEWPEYLSPEQVSERLLAEDGYEITAQGIRKWCNEGNIDGVFLEFEKRGGNFAIRWKWVREYFQNCTEAAVQRRNALRKPREIRESSLAAAERNNAKPKRRKQRGAK